MIGVWRHGDESGVNPCQGAGIGVDVTGNEYVRGQLGERLFRSGNDDHRSQRLAKTSHHMFEHRHWTERQSELGGSHPAAVPTTQDDSSDDNSRLLLHRAIVDAGPTRRIAGRG